MMVITYKDIISQRAKIHQKFKLLERKGRTFPPCNNDVLHFGSGDVNSPNHKEIEKLYSKVYSCDSDEKSGSDYKDIFDIVDKKFGMIICEHVLEHIPVEILINRISQKFSDLLIEDGILLVTLPNINNFSSYFSDYDHTCHVPPYDIASIICCRGFEVADMFRWSKSHKMLKQSEMNQTELFVENFMEMNYGLQLDQYVTMILKKKNG